MVTYCQGNIGAKRRFFRAAASERVASIDNDEVLADFLLDGKVYFVVGETPCGDMTVAEYVAYARALKTKLPANPRSIRAQLRRVGCRCRLYARMRALSRTEYRKVQLAALLGESTEEIYVNLDGLPYSRFTAGKVRRLMKRWGKKWTVHAAVSDSRFVPGGADCKVYLPDGQVRGYVPQRGHRISRLRLKCALSRHGMVFRWKTVKSVVLADN